MGCAAQILSIDRPDSDSIAGVLLRHALALHENVFVSFILLTVRGEGVGVSTDSTGSTHYPPFGCVHY